MTSIKVKHITLMILFYFSSLIHFVYNQKKKKRLVEFVKLKLHIH